MVQAEREREFEARRSKDWHDQLRAAEVQLALADALAESVRNNVHPQHSGISGVWKECVAEECAAARAYRQARA